MVKKIIYPQQKEPSLQSRRPLERMMKIHEALQRNTYPNCSQLGKELEVSSKTVARDLEFMRDSLRLPIVYDPQRFGFYYSETVTSFPTVQISEGELLALFLAQKALAQFEGTNFHRSLSDAFRKLTQSLPEKISFNPNELDSGVSFRSLGSSVADLQLFKTVSQAVIKHEEICFHYRKLQATDDETRRVHPYHLTCLDHQWYLLGFDTARRAIRTFALPRMKKVTFTGRTFTPLANFSAKDFLADSFGIFSSQKKQRVVLRFDAFAGQLVREKIWHESQKLVEKKNGEVELTMTLGSLPEVQRWILSWGEHVKVIAPKELRERVLDVLHKTLSRYTRPTSKR